MRQAVRALLATSFLSLVAVSSVYALDGTRVTAKIPFSFMAGEQSFPPGDYTFVIDDVENPALLTVESNNRDKYARMMLTETKGLVEAPDKSKVVFEKYEGQSYLSQIWAAGSNVVQVVPQNEIRKEEIRKEMEKAGS